MLGKDERVEVRAISLLSSTLDLPWNSSRLLSGLCSKSKASQYDCLRNGADKPKVSFTDNVLMMKG